MSVIENTESDISTMSLNSMLISNPKIVTPTDSEGNTLLIKTVAGCIDGVMPVSKGGTGLDSLDGNKLLASSADGVSLEEIDVAVEHLSGLTENIQDRLNRIRTFTADLDIGETFWLTGTDIDGTYYYQTVSVPLIKEEDTPLIGLISVSATKEGTDEENYAYSCIDAVETGDGTITFTCYEECPVTKITVSIICL